MPFSNYPNGFNDGVLIEQRQVVAAAPGKVFWVGNNATLVTGERGASDSNDGTYLHPFSTLDYAVGRCAANRGDIIFIRPGYTETITAADSVTFDVAGIKVIGLGQGTKMAEIEFNHANATVSINANDVTLKNIRFNATITSVAVGLNIKAGATDALVQDCVFNVDTVGTDEFSLCIDVKAGCHRTRIEGCTFDMDIAAAVAAVKLTGASDGVILRGNRVFGDYSTACLAGDTTLSTNVDIGNNLLLNGEGGDLNAKPTIELLTGSTGIIYNNYNVCNVAAAINSVVADTCLKFQNKYNETIATTGINLEVADA